MPGNYGRLQNILENHGAKIRDMLVQELIRSYISHTPVDAAQEQMGRIVRPGAQGMTVDRDELAALIESARSAAVIDAMEWKPDDRERLLKTTIDFLRDDFLRLWMDGSMQHPCLWRWEPSSLIACRRYRAEKGRRIIRPRHPQLPQNHPYHQSTRDRP